VKFGVNILNFGPGVSPEKLAAWARFAEAAGFDSIWISDHIAITPYVGERYPEPFYDPFTSLAWLASQTKTVQLGTTVIVLPYRNPALMARMVANLDNLSGGRFVFGAGVGASQDEFVALGVPWEKRGAIATDYLRAMLALWSSESEVTYQGRYVKFDKLSPIRSQQTPHPPVWVGGSSEASIRRAVRYGDAWHPFVRDMKQLKETGAPQLASIAAAEGKPAPAFCPRIRIDVRDAKVEGDRMPGVGNLDQVRADLLDLQKLGAEHIVLDWNTGDLEKTRAHDHGFAMLAMLAEKAFDLQRGELR